MGNPANESAIGAFGSVYPATKMSGRPSPFTSPTAAPACQPYSAMPAGRAISLKVPSPWFHSSASYVFDVTYRSVSAVQVDVGRHAAVAAQREVGARAAADVGERPSLVVEEGAAGEVALFPRAGDVPPRRRS